MSTSLIDISSAWLGLGPLTEAADLLVALCSSSLCLEEYSRLCIKLRQKFLGTPGKPFVLSILELFSLILLCVFPSLVIPACPLSISPSLQVATAWLSPFLALLGAE